MKTIIMHIDWPDRYSFFKRMLPGLESLGLKGVFLTNKLALHRRAIQQGIDSDLIVNETPSYDAELGDARELISQVLSYDEAQLLYSATLNSIGRIVERERFIKAIFVWNGSSVVAKSLADFGRNNGINLLYFEIANIPGKLFIDGEGVNAKSCLSRDARILDQFDIDEESFQCWLDTYLANNLATNTLPQATILEQTAYLDSIINWWGFRYCNIPTDDHTSLITKARRKKKIKSSLCHDMPKADKGRYVFYPMQVSNDSQILLNSDMGNIDAIRFSADLAKRNNCALIVKPHPAEPNFEEVQRILKLKVELGFHLSCGNTLDLIRRSHLIVTINSTVGLEAILLEKPVKFLGRTFYRHFVDKRRLAQYIMGYLIDIDYFAEEDIHPAMVGKVISRLSTSRHYIKSKKDS